MKSNKERRNLEDRSYNSPPCFPTAKADAYLLIGESMTAAHWNMETLGMLQAGLVLVAHWVLVDMG